MKGTHSDRADSPPAILVLKRLAEIVIDAKLASREQVLRAARISEEQRMPLVAVLVQHAGVDELALVAAIRRQVRVPLVDPAVVENDPEALREMPQEIARRLRVMPLAISAYDPDIRVMRLAMADPTDAMAIAEVEHVTGCRVEGHLMPLSAVEELIAESYRSFVTEVMRREPVAPPDSVPGQPLLAHDTHRIAVPEIGPSEPSPEAALEASQPSTVPFHRVADEASLELRHRALLRLLVDKAIIQESEYEEQIRLLMKRRTGES